MPAKLPDSVKNHRNALILNELKKGPKTLHELAKVLDTSYWTVRDIVKILEHDKYIQQMPFMKTRSVLYGLIKADPTNPADKRLLLAWQEDAYSLVTWTKLFSENTTFEDAFQRLAEIFAYMYIDTHIEVTDPNKLTFGPGMAVARQLLIAEQTRLRAAVELIEQVLHFPFWDSDKTSLEHMGSPLEETFSKLHKLAADFDSHVRAGTYG